MLCYSKRVWNYILWRDGEIRKLVEKGFELVGNFPWQDDPNDKVINWEEIFQEAKNLEEGEFKTETSRAYTATGMQLKGMRALWKKPKKRFFSVHELKRSGYGHISEAIYVTGCALPFRYDNGPLCGRPITGIDTFLPFKTEKVCKKCKKVYAKILGRKELMRDVGRFEKIIGRKRMKKAKTMEEAGQGV